MEKTKLTLNPILVVGKFEIQNFDEVENAVLQKIKVIKELVITCDKASIDEAKEKRAELNKFKKAINDERIRKEKEYMAGLIGSSQIKSISKIIDEGITSLDVKIKEYENNEDQKKVEEIKTIFLEIENPYNITIDKVWNPRWLNKSISLKTIKNEIEEIMTSVANDVTILTALIEKEDATEKKIVMAKYFATLNKDLAITEHLERKKITSQNVIIKKVENAEAEQVYDVVFHIRTSGIKIKNLGKYLKDNYIFFEQIKNGIIKDSKIAEVDENERL